MSMDPLEYFHENCLVFGMSEESAALAVKVLAITHGGQRPYIPKRYMRKIRDAEIVAGYVAGVSPNHLSLRHGVTKSTIEKKYRAYRVNKIVSNKP